MSLARLADAFAKEEALGGRVFAIFGCLDALASLESLMPPGSPNGVIWTAALIASDKPLATNVWLGVRRSGRYATEEDFNTIGQCAITPPDRQPTSRLWLRRFYLDG